MRWVWSESASATPGEERREVMMDLETIKILEEEKRERVPLSLIWKATLWLEGRYRQEGRLTLPFLIAQHYGLMAAHPEAREDPHLVELLMGHFRHWEALGKNEQAECEGGSL